MYFLIITEALLRVELKGVRSSYFVVDFNSKAVNDLLDVDIGDIGGEGRRVV